MNYLKYHLDELRGDEYDHWGTVTFYSEIRDDGYPIRDIKIYQNGNSLKYRFNDLIEDQYGMLPDQPIIENEIKIVSFEEITKEQFESLWIKSGFIDGNPQWKD